MSGSELPLIVDRIGELIAAVRDRNRTAQLALSGALEETYVPDSFARAVRLAFTDYSGSVDWALERIASLLVGAEALDAMDDAATGWVPISQAVAGAGEELSGLRPAISTSWEGRGGIGYQEAVGPQIAACDHLGHVAADTARTLRTLSGAGRTFYLSAGVALANFATSISVLPAALSSAFTAPTALATAATSGATLIAFLEEAESALGRQVDSAKSSAAAISAAAADPVHFTAGGHWPVVVTSAGPAGLAGPTGFGQDPQ